MRLLLDTMTVVAASNDSAELARNFTELFETSTPPRGGSNRRKAAFDLLGGLERVDGPARPFTVTRRTSRILGGTAARTISWHENRRPAQRPRAVRAAALLQDRCLGGIVLEVAS